MRINCMRELNAFMRRLPSSGLNTSDVALWLALFHIFNERAGYTAQRYSEFEEISVEEILIYARISEDTLTRSRNRLQQAGWISFTPGRRGRGRNSAARYRMNYLYPEETVENPVENLGTKNETPHDAGIPAGIPAGRIRDRYRDTDTEQRDTWEEDERGEDNAGAGAPRQPQTQREANIIASLERIYLTEYREMYGLAERQAEELVTHDRYTPEQVDMAMRETLNRWQAGRVRKPMAYTLKLLDSFERNGVRTQEDAERYRDAYLERITD